MIIFDAAKLTRLMLHRSLTREAIAAQMQLILGRDTISGTTVAYWQQGGCPRADMLWALAKVFNLPMECWFTNGS